MRRAARRALAAAASALVIALATPTAAQAETQTAKDPRGDVERGLVVTKAAKKRVIDIVSSTNRFSAESLRMSVRTTNLPPTNYVINWFVRVDGADYNGFYTTDAGMEQSGFFLRGRARRGLFGCAAAATADRERDTVTLRVSTGCLGSAESVRIASVVSRRIGPGLPRVDDARRKGFDQEKGPKYGPALAIG